MPLKDAHCRNAKPQEKTYRLYDEQGLYLEVQVNGGRYWRLKYRFQGKEKRLALGVYPSIGLLDARRQRDAAKELLANGQDPSLHKRMAKLVSRLDHQHTFQSVAQQWLAVREQSWTPEYTRTVKQRLELNAYPWLGKLPITAINTPILVENLQRIIKRGASETARRVAQLYKQIFEFAEAAGITNPNQIGNLARTLPAKHVKHFAAVTDAEQLGKLIAAMDSYTGTFPVCCALKLAPMLFCRPGELRQMEWAEVDLDAGDWLIPGRKMKGVVVKKADRPDHLVPLSRQAVSVLRELLPLTGRRRYVFPCARGGERPMSNNAILSALRRLGISSDETSGHGFRATARTLGAEVLGFRPDLLEHQLAHTVHNPLGRAYDRTTFLNERRNLMQSWSDYLDLLKRNAELEACQQPKG
ncbi:MAG: integrase arm-type DNA-binding domain-containing protein [Gammaproteobacteria bacterium]|nr:integrase arm-type DNA-binding domain-containing protein [Gammaproteobacteria bacterium]MBU0884668.1 integrase arm-type DNA-binding domain-containing protein [Gammaproteobacteria bacterium]MBU1861710.1 integrase arm-type DNA-binding domain-containing protein [Gammaproteobacteria bacterium]